ncbi:MAG: hypothetical protein JWN76_2905 [Chitinophagaceae bacterium]|nr:hypothetical protein [Chitinophagaceae bacterium]
MLILNILSAETYNMIKNLVIVGAGGMLGSVLRYICSFIIKSDSYPWATLAINITGSFFIGLILGSTLKMENGNMWRLFLATGICGGFTTFSAFSAECILLIQQNRWAAALSYIIISVMAGLAAAFAGLWITK